MTKIYLQGLDKPCSRLVLGTSGLAKEQQTAFELLDSYVQHGGNTLDIAPIYGHGKSELIIGQWMKSRQNRKDIILMEKGGHHHIAPDGTHDASVSRVNSKDITDDLVRSLDSLQVDYIDIYLLHRDDPSVPVDELMDMLQEHINSGLIKIAGVSNWTYKRIEEANHYADKKGYNRLVVNSPSLSLARINEPRWEGTVYIDQDYEAWHNRTKFPLFSWASQASGFFTGRFSPKNRMNPDMVRVYYNNENWERLNRAKKLAENIGSKYTANHIALAYVLNQSFPTCAVIGPQNVDELHDCFVALDITLSNEDKQWISLGDSHR